MVHQCDLPARKTQRHYLRRHFSREAKLLPASDHGIHEGLLARVLAFPHPSLAALEEVEIKAALRLPQHSNFSLPRSPTFGDVFENGDHIDWWMITRGIKHSLFMHNVEERYHVLRFVPVEMEFLVRVPEYSKIVTLALAFRKGRRALQSSWYALDATMSAM
jgi:hypothetical protein